MRQARWTNSLGEEVNLDNIDKEYALNILSMYVLNCGLRGYGHDAMREDPLVAKLREVVLNGRERNLYDRVRAVRYNILNRIQGKLWRAPVR